ncbi:MAG: hypothetical protein ABSF47_01300 [Minisyncoccia bacterium]|jgi:rubrerythrin
MYKCPNCGFVSEEPGECPMCHTQMIEEEEEENGNGSGGEKIEE